MFGSSPGSKEDTLNTTSAVDAPAVNDIKSLTGANNGAEKRNSVTASPMGRKVADDVSSSGEKKRRSSRAKEMLSSAKQSLHLGSSPTSSSSIDKAASSQKSKLSRSDPALAVQKGSLNNSAGESVPGPKSTFKVGVTEDKNKKCRRTMEDTHAYLYNFLSTPAPVLGSEGGSKSRSSISESSSSIVDPVTAPVVESDNGYFAIFDGHAGTYAADWCGKKLHLLLEDNIRRNPNTPIPELLDHTFTIVDQQLEKLPVKNSGCTAVIAVLRWEDRVPSSQSQTGSAGLAPALASAVKSTSESNAEAEGGPTPTTQTNSESTATSAPSAEETRIRERSQRQRVLYTANVGDARIVLCRNGRALRLSYDHKGSDENEGRRVANAGGLILNNRVNGVLAVTRALGDSYMKDLVTGHPYTTETVLLPDQDEFLILACDGLWDVCSDQEAVDLVRNTSDPQAASKQLVDHALARFSTDNLSCMIVRFDNKALKQRSEEASIGVDKDPQQSAQNVSEADAIVAQAKRSLDAGELDKVAGNMIVEEEEGEQEPGPELDAEALEKSKVKNKVDAS